MFRWVSGERDEIREKKERDEKKNKALFGSYVVFISYYVSKFSLVSLWM